MRSVRFEKGWSSIRQTTSSIWMGIMAKRDEEILLLDQISGAPSGFRSDAMKVAALRARIEAH